MAVAPEWRLVPEQETDLAERLTDADRRLRALLLRDVSAAPVIRAGPGRGRRGGADAVAVAVRAASDRSLAVPIARGWREVLDLRWKLAMSERRVAHVEARRRSTVALPYEDLVQEGLLGLLHAASRFEASRGIRFSTYGRGWVRAFVARALVETGRHVRLPSGAEEQLRRLHVAMRERERSGLAWDIDGVAADAGVEVERAHLLLGQGAAVSLDDLEVTFDLHIARSTEAPQDEQVEGRERVERVGAAIAEVLDERQRYIIRQRFGLEGDGDERTLLEVGTALRLTKERVRQLERKALQRLATRGGLRRL